MGTRTVPSDDALELELAGLRARAYGADADIERDPAALGRLAELEEWHAAGVQRLLEEEDVSPDEAGVSPAEADASPAVPLAPVIADQVVEAEGESDESAQPVRMRSVGDRARSLLQRASRTRAGLFALGAAAMAAVVLLGTIVLAWVSPRADATLQARAAPTEPYVLLLVDHARELLIDKSTLSTYDRYRGVEVWSAESTVGNSCLIALERSSDRLLAAGCVPPGAEPVIEIYDVPAYSTDRWHYGLPTGTVARFTLSGDVVSVRLYPGVPRG